jgi:hypothetical protein
MSSFLARSLLCLESGEIQCLLRVFLTPRQHGLYDLHENLRWWRLRAIVSDSQELTTVFRFQTSVHSSKPCEELREPSASLLIRSGQKALPSSHVKMLCLFDIEDWKAPGPSQSTKALVLSR